MKHLDGCRYPGDDDCSDELSPDVPFCTRHQQRADDEEAGETAGDPDSGALAAQGVLDRDPAKPPEAGSA
ncbi:MAG: hypothetical protein ACR2JQ_06445 [Mycobacteriales bacterium]